MDFNISTTPGYHEFLELTFSQRYEENKYYLRKKWKLQTPKQVIPVEFEKISINPSGYTAYLVYQDCYLLIHCNDSLALEIVGNDLARVESVVLAFEKLYPSAVIQDNKVFISFWTNSANGARSRIREIEVPSWLSIENNYTVNTRAELSRVFKSEFAESSKGKLLLWTGKPGTGKTFAIRAFLNSLRFEAEFLYILDPENFLGADSNYMMSVLLEENESIFVPEEERVIKPKYKVLILEDVGELISKDAKLRVGQGFSRLLNVLDGLIGQGLNLFILLTSNDELKDFHSAVMRSGRIESLIQFEPFKPDEANRWLASKNSDKRVGEKIVLSDLYALLGNQEVKELKALGF